MHIVLYFSPEVVHVVAGDVDRGVVARRGLAVCADSGTATLRGGL
ncbi:MAG: hypothetical protein QOF67_3472 [Mycobacterium sp.]|nr:hypothetical protein [Mycobacterium sp.]